MVALPLRVVEVSPGRAGALAVREALAGRLRRDGMAFAPVPMPSRHVTHAYAESIRACVRPDEPLEDADTAFIAATSGSTGDPRGVIVTRAGLRAAAEASWQRIPGLRECSWVLALPATSMGGLGVIARAELAGTPLHVIPSVGGAAAFRSSDLSEMSVNSPFAISLVPAQLVDILQSSDATAWLGEAAAVLVGAAATPDELAARAREAGIPLVTTYGMTETTGGCVYDGTPLPGVRIELDDEGRVDIVGAQVAAGYRGLPDATAQAFAGAAPERRFRTADRATWQDGRLRVLGRIDDVVTVRGVNVALGAVESVLRDDSRVQDAAVVSIPDHRQGQRVVAFVVTDEPGAGAGIAEAVAQRLGGAARPEVVVVDALPLLPTGKIDRLSLRRLAQGG